MARARGSSTPHASRFQAKPEAKRHASEAARFRATHQYAPVGIAEVTLRGGRILDVNEKLCSIVGYTRDELLKKTVAQITEPGDYRREMKLLKQLCSGAIASYTVEKRYFHKSTAIVWVRVTSSIATSTAVAAYRISIVEDITASKQMESALRDSEARQRAIVDTAADAIITIDERGLIESANPAAVELFGYSVAELFGKNISMLMPDPYHGEHDGYLRAYVRTGRARIIGIGREVVGLHKGGRIFPIRLAVSEMQLGGRRMFTGIVHDLTNRRRLEREIIEASGNEQRRIGQDLHDGLCQQLVGVSFGIENLARQLDRTTPAEAAVARKQGELLRDAITQARQLARGLNPVTLDRLGLAASLKDLADRVSDTFRVACRFTAMGDIPALDGSIATHLYRIAQEAVSNACRHGKASRIDLRLTATRDALTLAVSDDGKGLPKDRIGAPIAPMGAGKPMPHSSGGMGLHSMHYRARLMGGVFDVRAGRSGGAVVSCSVPIDSIRLVEQARDEAD